MLQVAGGGGAAEEVSRQPLISFRSGHNLTSCRIFKVALQKEAERTINVCRFLKTSCSTWEIYPFLAQFSTPFFFIKRTNNQQATSTQIKRWKIVLLNSEIVIQPNTILNCKCWSSNLIGRKASKSADIPPVSALGLSTVGHQSVQ